MTRQTRPSSMLRCGDERGKRCDGRFPSVARSADSEAHAGTRRERRDGARGVRRDTHSERHRLRRRPRAGASGAPLKRVGALAEPADVEVKRADRRVRGRLGHFGDDEKACQQMPTLVLKTLQATTRSAASSREDARRRDGVALPPRRVALARAPSPRGAPRGARVRERGGRAVARARSRGPVAARQGARALRERARARDPIRGVRRVERRLRRALHRRGRGALLAPARVGAPEAVRGVRAKPHRRARAGRAARRGDRACLLYTSPSPRDRQKSRMPSSA